MERKTLTHINGIEIFRRKIELLPKNKDLLSRFRSLRKGYVLSEVIFWKQVRNKEFHQIDFDRQKIIGNYIVDFYIKSLGVVLEIDGSSHNDKEEYDEKRQLFLESLDLVVYRISDNRIKNDLGNVMKELEDFIIEKFS
ncbi:endonuclease domain-containing protein [Cloacibacterium sp.]|uniref:endonuclease domain-containing protein n=1 Tax=Cloacibacterium sp. TaxID=1913682 RepID=UPI0035B39763